MAYDKRKRRTSNKSKDTSKSDDKYKKVKDELNQHLNSNDPTWYFRDPVLKSGLTRMPTFEFLGTDIPINGTVYAGTNTATVSTATPTTQLTSPTVAVYKMNPSPGRSYSNADPVNMAARMLYSKLSSSNAKTSNYAPQDVATLMLALGEIISMINHFTRLYGITQFYNKMNRAIPASFLKAHGISPNNVSEWTQKLPDFRAELNQLITVMNSVAFPANIPYFKKCAYVYQNIYIDNYSAMTGYHIMVPNSTWIVDETSYEQGTILKTTSPYGDNYPLLMTSILSKLRSMIDAILTSTTYNYIYSDILNLASRGVLGSDLLSFGTIPIDYVVEPILSDQFNWQIMNATIFGDPNASDFSGSGETAITPENDVYPDVNGNILLYAPRWTFASSIDWHDTANILEPIVRCPNVDVSEDDLIELLVYTGSTRNSITSGTGGVFTATLLSDNSIPDHYIASVDVYYGNISVNTTPASTASNSINKNNAIAALSSEFEHFPMIYAYLDHTILASGLSKPTTFRLFGRLGTYTLKIKHAIKNVRDASLLGLFTME